MPARDRDEVIFQFGSYAFWQVIGLHRPLRSIVRIPIQNLSQFINETKELQSNLIRRTGLEYRERDDLSILQIYKFVRGEFMPLDRLIRALVVMEEAWMSLKDSIPPKLGVDYHICPAIYTYTSTMSSSDKVRLTSSEREELSRAINGSLVDEFMLGYPVIFPIARDICNSTAIQHQQLRPIQYQSRVDIPRPLNKRPARFQGSALCPLSSP